MEFRRIVPFRTPKVPATETALIRSASNNQTKFLKGDCLAMCFRRDPVIFNISWSVPVTRDFQILARRDSTISHPFPLPFGWFPPDLTRFDPTDKETT